MINYKLQIIKNKQKETKLSHQKRWEGEDLTSDQFLLDTCHNNDNINYYKSLYFFLKPKN